MKLKFLIIYLSLFLIDIELTMATDLNCVQGIWKIKYDEKILKINSKIKFQNSNFGYKQMICYEL